MGVCSSKAPLHHSPLKHNVKCVEALGRRLPAAARVVQLHVDAVHGLICAEKGQSGTQLEERLIPACSICLCSSSSSRVCVCAPCARKSGTHTHTRMRTYKHLQRHIHTKTHTHAHLGRRLACQWAVGRGPLGLGPGRAAGAPQCGPPSLHRSPAPRQKSSGAGAYARVCGDQLGSGRLPQGQNWMVVRWSSSAPLGVATSRGVEHISTPKPPRLSR